MTTPPSQQIPGIYHRKIGDIVVTAISDGYLDGSLDVMRNVDLDAAHQVLKDASVFTQRLAVCRVAPWAGVNARLICDT